MSDDDLIRRGDALDAVAAAIGKSGGNDEFGNMMQEVILQNEDDQEAIAALPAVTPGVRVKPTDAQVASACLSYRHDFGLLDGLERTLVLHQARDWLHAWQKELDLTPQPAPDATIRDFQTVDAPDVAGVVEAAKALRDLAIQNTDNREEWDAVIAKLDFALAAMEGKV